MTKHELDERKAEAHRTYDSAVFEASRALDVAETDARKKYSKALDVAVKGTLSEYDDAMSEADQVLWSAITEPRMAFNDAVADARRAYDAAMSSMEPDERHG